MKTTLSPDNLLKELQSIEKLLGRVKTGKWGPRIIDIDILLFSDFVVNQPHLTIPHPYICERSFVLAPLYELNPHVFIPNLGRIKDNIEDKSLIEGIIDVIPWQKSNK